MEANAPSSFLTIVSSKSKYRMFLLSRLPAAFFAGLRIESIDEKQATVSVPYKWFTKNPFRSTYFACLAMAAEMSTGLLAMARVYGRKPSVSMLITGMESRFFKKATATTWFVCEEGEAIANAVEAAISTGEPQTIRVRALGRSKAGEEIAEFYFTWSFKSKSKI